jgi:hypothetical protein
MDTVVRYIVALNLARTIAQYIVECRAIVAKMSGNAYFPNLAISLALVSQHLDALDAAHKASFKGPKGTVSARKAAMYQVRSDMRQLKAAVQAAADADIANGQAIIESTGMLAVRQTRPPKPDLAAKYAGVPGLVRLVGRAFRGKGVYQWQMSTDQKTWTDLPQTTTAKTTVTGLAAGTICFFRFRTQTGKGLSDWSTAVSIIAH